MARVLLALYDPSQASTEGSFWSWRAAALNRDLLDRFYYEVAVKGRPADVSAVADDDVIGGMAVLSDAWACVWRFGNGGRDTHGRPGRFVLLVGFVATADVVGKNWFSLLNAPLLQEALRSAVTSCPTPSWQPLEFEYDFPTAPNTPAEMSELLRDGDLNLAGPITAGQVAALSGNMPPDRYWTCQLRLTAGTSAASFELRETTSATPPCQRLDEDASPNRGKSVAGVRPSLAARQHPRLRAANAIIAVAAIGVVFGTLFYYFPQPVSDRSPESQPPGERQSQKTQTSRPPPQTATKSTACPSTKDGIEAFFRRLTNVHSTSKETKQSHHAPAVAGHSAKQAHDQETPETAEQQCKMPARSHFSWAWQTLLLALLGIVLPVQ